MALLHRDKGARGKTPVPFHLSGRKGDSPILLGAEARAATCSGRDRKDGSLEDFSVLTRQWPHQLHFL